MPRICDTHVYNKSDSQPEYMCTFQYWILLLVQIVQHSLLNEKLNELSNVEKILAYSASQNLCMISLSSILHCLKAMYRQFEKTKYMYIIAMSAWILNTFTSRNQHLNWLESRHGCRIKWHLKPSFEIPPNNWFKIIAYVTSETSCESRIWKAIYHCKDRVF